MLFPQDMLVGLARAPFIWGIQANHSIQWRGRGFHATLNQDLVAWCEHLGILPDQHFGGCPGRCTTDLVHLMVASIKDAWHEGNVVTVLFLDVKGAFPSVDVDMLIHEMLMMGIPV